MFTNVLPQVNVGSLALLFAVRQQINLKTSELRGHVWTRAIATAVVESEARSAGNSFGDDGKEDLSRSAIRQLARAEPDTARGHSASQIATLSRAATDLLIIAWTVAQIASGASVVTLAITILLIRRTFFSTPWPW